MKKIIMIFILIFIFSCSKHTDKENIILSNNNTNTLELSKDSENITNNNLVNENNIINNNLTNQNNTDYSKLIEEYKNYPTLDKSNLFCEDIFNIQKEVKLKPFFYSCLKIREKAKKDIIESKTNFKISDCENLIKNSNIGGPPNISKENFMKLEIERCEMSYALRTGCENFTDTNKKAYCEELKEFQKKQYLIESAKNFEVGEYLR